MIRKPMSIVALSIIFFLSPLAILSLNAAISMVPLFGFESIIFRLKIYDIFILILYPLTGVSIFIVKKWGWWVIITSAVIMIIYNIIMFYLNPFSSLFLILFMNLVLFAITLVFFRKHIIAPYFNPQLRWWEQDQRYEIDIYLKFLGMNRNVIISDISEGGCYIFVDFLIDAGSELPVKIVCGSLHLTVNAKVMRIARESDRYFGYGLMFQKIDDVEREGLRQLLKKLKSFSSYDNENIDSDEKRSAARFFISYNLSLSCENVNNPINLVDVSKSGCSLRTSMDLETGHKCHFHFRMEEKSHSIPSRIIWKKSNRDSKQYGVKFLDFDRESRSALLKMISSITKLGAKKRGMDKDDYDRKCDEKLNNTPYKIVQNLSGLWGKKAP